MFCEKCGKPIDMDKTICDECAAQQQANAATQPEAPVQPVFEAPQEAQPAVEEALYQAAPAQPAEAPEIPQDSIVLEQDLGAPKKKKKRTGLVIGILAAVVAAAVLAVVLCWGSLKGFWLKNFGDPAEYMLYVEEKALAEGVSNFSEQYDAALAQKRRALTTSETPEGQKIRDMEQQVAVLQSYAREIREAINAGSSARGTADQILRELDSAQNWNTWDMFGGSGIITHMAKHGHLDSAQDLTEELQRKLRRFKTELADIQITADTQVNIDGFLRFADYFFDGLFADWAVGNRISESISSVTATRSKISSTITKLEAMESKTRQEIERLKTELDSFIVQA